MGKYGILPLVFAGVGVLCLVAGIANYIQEEAFFATAEQYTATLTKYIPDPNSRVADFCPVYEFTTKTDQKHSYVGDDCPSQPDPSKIGQHEQAYIDPKNPQSVESRGLLGSEGSGLIMGLLGFVFFPAIGLLNIFTQRTRKKPNTLLEQAEQEYMAKQRAAAKEQKKTGGK